MNGREHKYETFQGQELEEELGKNTLAYQWRDYDPAIARFNKIDRFAEKYVKISPYTFTANNPIYFNEVKGDSINVKRIQMHDTQNNTNYTQQIINDLNKQTGFSFSVNSNGQLVYQTDSNGNATISTSTDANGNTIQNGSAEARKIMTHAVSTTDQAYASINPNGRTGATGTGSPIIRFNPNQINDQISGANNVDNKTQGWGMTFMHEILHSKVAEGGPTSHGREKTNFGSTGLVVNRMNNVRRELNAKGGNYGIRKSYQAQYFNSTTRKPSYLPFDSRSLRAMNNGNPPPSNTMFLQLR